MPSYDLPRTELDGESLRSPISQPTGDDDIPLNDTLNPTFSVYHPYSSTINLKSQLSQLFKVYKVCWVVFFVIGKGQVWEGGVRMPTIVSWPGHIPAGILLDELTSTMDLLPTVAKLAGGGIPQDRIVDGKDLLPLLTNQTKTSSHDFIFHYCGDQIHAVRYHPKNSDVVWKAHLMTPKWTEGTDYCTGTGVCMCHGDHVTVHDQPLLFDITNDPAENTPIATDRPEYQDVMKHIHPAVKAHKESIEGVPSQLDWHKTAFHPHLQMCCNFPFCSCMETNRKLEHYPHNI